MMRRGRVALASAFPRHTWDPTHHDPRAIDSYGKHIADRRVWPAKQYSIGLEPQTPEDWQAYSKRNLAYAYNGALRSCATFPEMLPYYDEMKRRGVKVDLDTMFVMLSRAARFDKMALPEVFTLFDELQHLGARPDLAIAEVLHTVWEHAAAEDADWREARRRQLVDLFNDLALQDVAKYGAKGLDKLMAQQLGRHRSNLRQLGGALRPEVWAAAMKHITETHDLVAELCAMMWDRAPSPAFKHEVVAGNLTVPKIHAVMTRAVTGPADGALLWGPPAYDPVLVAAGGEAAAPVADATELFEDRQVCAVVLAALEQLVEHEFEFQYTKGGAATQAQMANVVLHVAWKSGVLLTADVFAQAMDIVKYAPPGKAREEHAVRFFRFAARGAGERNSEAAEWLRCEAPGSDARVVARYLGARDPWGARRFTMDDKGNVGAFHSEKAEKDDAEAAAPDAADEAVANAAAETQASRARELRTGADVDSRLDNARDLLDATAAAAAGSARSGPTPLGRRLDKEEPIRRDGADEGDAVRAGARRFHRRDGVQLMTALASMLRQMAAAERSNLSVLEACFRQAVRLRKEMDLFFHEIAAAAAEDPALVAPMPGEECPAAAGPETECWESLVVMLRGMLDTLAVAPGRAKSPEEKKRLEALYDEVSKVRHELVAEARTRFDGKFKMIWLHEV